MGSLFERAYSFNTHPQAGSFEAAVAEASALLEPVALRYETLFTELHRQLAPKLEPFERAFIEVARLIEPYGSRYIETATVLDLAVRRHVAEPRVHRPRLQPLRPDLPRWMLDDGPDLAWRASLEDLADL